MSARLFASLVLVALLAACAHLPPERLRQAEQLALAARSTESTCATDDACALRSPWRDEADSLLAASSGVVPRHRVVLLEGGEDALLARVHLIRAARSSIELQTYLFADDDAGRLILDELLAAARRGVQVRVLLDQLFSVDDIHTLVALASAHVNFSLRMYNPTFGEARTSGLEFGASIICCLARFQRRMHSKLLVVDDALGITGGRNYQNRYFDWDSGYNYRDRDILVAGPVVGDMRSSFDAFWNNRRSLPLARLHDVARELLDSAGQALELPPARLTRVERSARLAAMASDPEALAQHLWRPSLLVGRVEYLADPPDKYRAGEGAGDRAATMSPMLYDLVSQARDSVVLQTPYLALSRRAQRLFHLLQVGPDKPRIVVSTNSLAATDAWPVYAISHKYKRTYLRKLGFQIWEYKPFPLDSPIDLEATGALDPSPPLAGADLTDTPSRFGSAGTRSALRGSGSRRHGPVPLAQAGVRIGLHAKSLVVDDRIGVVGTHNFDPRSDRLNTESALIVFDPDFAQRLAAAIHRDASPDNAWLIARRPKPPILSGLDYSLGKLFEKLPLFDLWPFRYASSYELVAACRGDGMTLSASAEAGLADPARSPCWKSVGSFPQVDVPLKGLYTRLMTAFGAGLAPVL